MNAKGNLLPRPRSCYDADGAPLDRVTDTMKRTVKGAKPFGGRSLERRVLREEIRDHLMRDILEGRLRPGERIIETRVAQQFGVSQAPVREALRDLEMFGFIATSPFRGAVVREMSPADLVQVYPIRAVLEGLAARDAAMRLDERGLAGLEKLIETMRKAAARGDHRAQIDADFRFHLAIVEGSGNWLLKQFWERMRLANTTLLTVARSRHSMMEIADRHVPVLEALRARDPETAERAMRQHIEEPGHWLRASLEDEQTQQEPAAKPPIRRRVRAK
jgi:DNA-binding GntR family transcriptional regulator